MVVSSLSVRPVARDWMGAVAVEAERRLSGEGIRLTLGGEPTVVPLEPDGAEWSVAADGPTKLAYARRLAEELQRRAWPGSTLLFCPGKRYDGEVNPRWALRLLTGPGGRPLVGWPQDRVSGAAEALPAKQAKAFLKRIGAALGCRFRPLRLRDPRDPGNRVWAVPLCHRAPSEDEPEAPVGWQAASWPLAKSLRELLPALGPAGLRLPLQHFPEGVLRQVLTLEISSTGWNLFLPPLAREPLEELLTLIAAASAGWSRPDLSGVLPVDLEGRWQVLGLTADPGVLEINLPVCHGWADYAGWIHLLAEASDAVGLRSWKQQGDQQEPTGGGNHLLWGGPSLEQNPFFSRPAWLVGILRFWQRHPSLSYLFSNRSVGSASQAPRLDEGSASALDLQLAHRAIEQLPEGDQRQLISETLRHLHADRSGNTHRSEISFDKFWNPAWSSGCQGLIEFRAIESLPDPGWTAAIALLWSALAAHLLNPAHRPARLEVFGERLHDTCQLPAFLWDDLCEVLDLLASDGLALQPECFRAIWDWRFPLLLRWEHEGAQLEIRRALEPWPLLCDVPVEGGNTSRFVDSSLQRLELKANTRLLQTCRLWLNGRPLPLGDGWLGLRYRHSRLYPSLHPCLDPHLPLRLAIEAPGAPLARFCLGAERGRFEAVAPSAVEAGEAEPLTLWCGDGAPWPAPPPGRRTLDLRLP